MNGFSRKRRKGAKRTWGQEVLCCLAPLREIPDGGGTPCVFDLGFLLIPTDISLTNTRRNKVQTAELRTDARQRPFSKSGV
jgi:hypothetical protein